MDKLAKVIALSRFTRENPSIDPASIKDIMADVHDEQDAATVSAHLLSDDAVERVARAIADDLKSRAVYVSDDLRQCLVDGGLFDLHDPARAAITALLETK